MTSPGLAVVGLFVLAVGLVLTLRPEQVADFEARWQVAQMQNSVSDPEATLGKIIATFVTGVVTTLVGVGMLWDSL